MTSAVKKWVFLNNQSMTEPIGPSLDHLPRYVLATDYARLEQECAELRAEEPEWSALQQRLGDENKRLREALQQIIDQYPNPDLSHVDYRVHACRCAEQALSAKPCAPTK